MVRKKYQIVIKKSDLWQLVSIYDWNVQKMSRPLLFRRGMAHWPPSISTLIMIKKNVDNGRRVLCKLNNEKNRLLVIISTWNRATTVERFNNSRYAISVTTTRRLVVALWMFTGPSGCDCLPIILTIRHNRGLQWLIAGRVHRRIRVDRWWKFSRRKVRRALEHTSRNLQ